MYPARKLVVASFLTLSLAACSGDDTPSVSSGPAPVLEAIEPAAGGPGDEFRLRGARFVDSRGNAAEIHFGDTVVSPRAWDSTWLIAGVPENAVTATVDVRVRLHETFSNALTYAVSISGPTEDDPADDDEENPDVLSLCDPTACPEGTVTDAKACHATGDTVRLTAQLNDLLYDDKLVDARLLLLDNTSGLTTGACALADTTGKAVLDVPADTRFALRVTSTNGRAVHTFHQLLTENSSRTYYGLRIQSYSLLESYIGGTPAPGSGVVFGIVYRAGKTPYFTWATDFHTASTAWAYEGETTVTTAPTGGTAVYTTSGGWWSDTQTYIHPDTGRFIVYNVEAGPATLAYFQDGSRVDVDHADMHVFADGVTVIFPVCNAAPCP